MIHCHNLVHEDHDMMSQFRIGRELDGDPNDPIDAAPAW
jgi:spore coat protein A, manganese oxidase